MAGKQDFTEQEWHDLSEGPMGLAMLVSAVDPGFLDKFKEAWAASNAFVKGASTDLQRELAKPSMPSIPKGSAEEVKAAVVGSLQRAVAALQAKAPEELEPYKAWVASVADAVAQAGGGVSEAESSFIASVKAAMQSPDVSGEVAKLG